MLLGAGIICILLPLLYFHHSLKPAVKWAQREDLVFITIQSVNVVDEVITLTANKLSFTGKAGPEKKEYAVDLEFHGEVVPEESTRLINTSKLFFSLKKKDDGYWPRLLYVACAVHVSLRYSYPLFPKRLWQPLVVNSSQNAWAWCDSCWMAEEQREPANGSLQQPLSTLSPHAVHSDKRFLALPRDKRDANATVYEKHISFLKLSLFGWVATIGCYTHARAR